MIVFGLTNAAQSLTQQRSSLLNDSVLSAAVTTLFTTPVRTMEISDAELVEAVDSLLRDYMPSIGTEGKNNNTILLLLLLLIIIIHPYKDCRLISLKC